MKSLCLAFLLLPGFFFGQISDARKLQLDSLTTHLPAVTRKDLESTRILLSGFAENDEERVWLFYGYIGTWFHYDKRRKGDLHAPPLNPELTAKKGKGVCRDFSDVFTYLCTKSGIECLNVKGKSKLGIVGTAAAVFSRVFFRVSMGVNHEWNTAKINGKWYLFDPTWTSCTTETFSRGTKKYKVKRVSRTYFMAEPKFMQKRHAPIHPAFYLSPDIPKFRKGFRKHPRFLTTNYDYETPLKTMSENPFPRFCREYIDGAFRYSHVGILRYEYQKVLGEALIRPRHHAADYLDRKIREVDSVTNFLRTEYNVFYQKEYDETMKQLNKRKKSTLQAGR